MNGKEQDSSSYRSQLRIGGVVAIAMGVTNLVDLNSTIQDDLAKEMQKPSVEEVSHAKTILSEAGEAYWQTEKFSTFKEPAVVAAKKVINQKDEFYTEAWNRFGDHKERIIFDALLVGGGITLRNRVKKEGEEDEQRKTPIK